MSSGPVSIGTIQFKHDKVHVYYDQYSTNEGVAYCSWRARNPDSFYTGIMYMGPDGKCTYPEGAVIPKQTLEDRELIPKFVLIGVKELTPELEGNVQQYLESEHRRRNPSRHK